MTFLLLTGQLTGYMFPSALCLSTLGAFRDAGSSIPLPTFLMTKKSVAA